jgi:hypothetical protein
VFDKTPESWDRIGDSAHNLVVSTFGEEFSGQLLGGTDEVVAYESLEKAFESPETTVITLDDPNTGELAGFTLSMPIGKMYPERESESDETSYIYFTVLQEKFRGQKLVGKLTDPLFVDLANNGYKFVERDSMIEDGYADKISRHYEGSIVESYDHTRFPEVGPERFFRIDIDKYLQSQDLASTSQ